VNRSELHTATLHAYLDRLQGGDDTAFDDLIRRTEERLYLLARRILHQYPGVRRWEDTGDVLQDALLRLVRDLRDKRKRPSDPREFFRLAASRIRSVLLDLHRHYQGPCGLGANVVAAREGAAAGGGPDPVAPAPSSSDMERWTAFHEAVERLEPKQREVVGLLFYHGWKQAEVAELLQMSVRTVSKYWAGAIDRLRETLRDPAPESRADGGLATQRARTVGPAN
jgi:RNA polymerase sigma-70 factor (ECF subfamily)